MLRSPNMTEMAKYYPDVENRQLRLHVIFGVFTTNYRLHRSYGRPDDPGRNILNFMILNTGERATLGPPKTQT